MKAIAVLFLFCGLPAFAQTMYHVNEPDPDQVRVEHLTDKEAADLAALSDKREKALRAYLDAREAYTKVHDNLADKYHAVVQKGDCSTGRVDVEWKGTYIIVEKYPSYQSQASFGLGCGVWTAPASGAITGELTTQVNQQSSYVR